ncbi:DUF2927 domain-containing protein [Bacillus spongiae]|uniref:DUF2927 domain-containing protein n=1 Tax=Bacillus spongiae TaxID=2683610 RepID=A0ABU8H8G5_9BACI
MKKMLLLFLFLFLTGCSLKPSIEVEGVEDKKIYTTEQTVQIDEKLAGQFTMKLNEEDIQPGHTIKENGAYKLEIEAKKWGIKETKTISFEIDDQPPNEPSFHDAPLDRYFKKAKLRLKRVEDVTYEFLLDGEPYMDTATEQDSSLIIYAEEGDHTFNIIAKKKNGLTSETTIPFSMNNTMFSREEIDLFYEIMFKTEEDDYMLGKWLSDTNVQVHGTPTDEDLEALESYLEQVNVILPIDLILVDNEAGRSPQNRIDIYFVPKNQFYDLGWDEDISGITGFTSYYPYYTGEGFGRSDIIVGIEEEERDRKLTILNLLLYSLGIPNRFDEDDSESIITPNSTDKIELSDEYKKMIEILYLGEIRLGMNETRIEKAIKHRIIEDE